MPTCFHFPSKNPSKSHQNPILIGIVFLINFCIDFLSILVRFGNPTCNQKGAAGKGDRSLNSPRGRPDASEDALDVQNPPRTPKWTQNGSSRPLKCFQNETSNPPRVHPNLTPHPHPLCVKVLPIPSKPPTPARPKLLLLNAIHLSKARRNARSDSAALLWDGILDLDF